MLKKDIFSLEKESWFEYLIVFLLLAIYIRALFVPLIDKDAAHHANIALNMIQRNDYFSLIDRGKDYLDKPHLLFWASVLSFKIFGVTEFAHRLPALLFSLLAVYSTYKLTRHLSDKTTAKMAALILATSQLFIMSIMDARMEPPLTAFIITGIWQLVVYIDKQRFLNLLGGAFAVAMAFSTKGWIGPIMVFSACFFKILLENRWAILANIRTWSFVPMFAVFICPVLYAYYFQFDQHPEKVIRGMSHISGVKFILWDQNFERFHGGNWSENGRNSSFFFLFHTFLWAFLPWCAAAYLALIFWVRRLVKRKKTGIRFASVAVSFLFVLCVVSMSSFKMPHYILMFCPLAAVFTAPYLRLALSRRKGLRIYRPLQIFIAAAGAVLSVILNFYFFKPVDLFVGIALIAVLLLLLVLIFTRPAVPGRRILAISAVGAIVINSFMNFNFFPTLMKYQGGNEMAKEMKARHISIPNDDIIVVDHGAHSFDFYTGYNHRVIEIHELDSLYPGVSNKYFLINSQMKRALESRGYQVQPRVITLDYRVSMPRGKFLNEKTRLSVCDSLILGKIRRPSPATAGL
ncbi:MAG TPA: glycosyltransferase family 39 protein [Sphingobacteriaceae bacterium]